MLKWQEGKFNNGAGVVYSAHVSDYNGYKIFLLPNPHGMITTEPFIKTTYTNDNRTWPVVVILDSQNNLINAMQWIDSQAGAEYSAKVP